MSGKLRASGFSSSSDSFYHLSADDDEAEVAGVLFRLPDLIRKFESVRRFPPCWGAKRSRSVIPASDSPELNLPVNGKLDYVSSSPTSPLTFSSHADLDTKHVLSKKKVGEEWFKDCGRSTESTRDKLNGVHESVSGVSESLELQLFSPSQPLVHHSLCHQQPLMQQEMGPRGIPDLNAPAAEEFNAGGGMEWGPPPLPQPQLVERGYMAESRAEAAALARQRRHLIQKCKRATRGSR